MPCVSLSFRAVSPLSRMAATGSGGAALKQSIQSGYTMVHHANLQGAAAWLGCTMQQSSRELQKALALSNRTHKTLLMNRRNTILGLREEPRMNWGSYFAEAAELEKEIAPFFDARSKEKEDLEDDALGQISFQHDLLRPLNHVPFAIAIIAFFKVWLVPAMTVLTPLLAWIVPYVLLKFVYALPINQEQYSHILKSLWSGNLFNPEEGLSSLWSGRSVFQMILFGFSFLQSLVQPVQNAMHLYHTDKVFYGVGKKLVRLGQLVQTLRAELGPLNGRHAKLSFSLQGMSQSDPRAAFMLVKEQPERLQIILRDLARLELLWRISQKGELNAVRFTANEFHLEQVLDISLQNGGTPSSVHLTLGETPHAVLTGPNGGGKSSFLRSLLQTVLFAHSFGMAPAEEAEVPMLSWIASGLQLRDTPGELSMFETEVKFAADCLSIAPNQHGPGLLLFDELFHSTNPPDGIRTAERFLRAVWAKQGLFSIVSTHVFSLVESAPAHVRPICCQAERKEDGTIDFSYRVEPGICRVSSVETVWNRFGLGGRAAAAAGPRPGPGPQSLPSEETNAH